MKKILCALALIISSICVQAQTEWNYPLTPNNHPMVFLRTSYFEDEMGDLVAGNSGWTYVSNNLDGWWYNISGSISTDTLAQALKNTLTRDILVMLNITGHGDENMTVSNGSTLSCLDSQTCITVANNIKVIFNKLNNSGYGFRYFGGMAVCDYDPESGWRTSDVDAAAAYAKTKFDIDTMMASSRMDAWWNNPPSNFTQTLYKNAKGIMYEIEPGRTFPPYYNSLDYNEAHQVAFANFIKYCRANGKISLWLANNRNYETLINKGMTYLKCLQETYKWMKAADVLPDIIVLTNTGDYSGTGDKGPMLPEVNIDGTYPNTTMGCVNWLLHKLNTDYCNPVNKKYEMNTGGGWETGFSPSVTKLTVTGGALSFTVSGTDAYITSPDNLGICASSNPHILVRIKNNTPGTVARLYFQTSKDVAYIGNYQSQTIKANDNNWQTYRFDMTSHAGWTGNIKRIRLDVPNDASSGTVEIDFIYLGNFESPVAFAGNDTTICSSSSITLTASGGTTYNWSTGASNASITVTPTSTTTYTVTATMNGLTSSDEIIINVTSCTQIYEQILSQTIHVYPNPTDCNGFYIEFDQNKPTSENYIELLNLQGQIIERHHLSGNSKEFIFLDHLNSSGIYFLRFTNPTNTIFKKIIVK